MKRLARTWACVLGAGLLSLALLASCSEDKCDVGAYKCEDTVLMYCPDESWAISSDCGAKGKGCASKCASGKACCVD